MSTIDVQLLPAGTWQVDKVHSSIGFAVDYMAGTFHGTFSDFDAAVNDGVLNGSATVASVQVKDDNLAAHLQGPHLPARVVELRHRRATVHQPAHGRLPPAQGLLQARHHIAQPTRPSAARTRRQADDMTATQIASKIS